MTTKDRTITCPSCRGQGHVEGNDCSCQGWGRLRVRVLGPCDAYGEVKTVPLSQSPEIREAYDRVKTRMTGGH